MPLTACLDCGELVSAPKYGRCAEHARAKNAEPRKLTPRRSSAVRNSRAWRGVSMRLRADQPWCSRCGTQGSKNNPLTVDHLVPVSKGGDLLPPDDELQVLCRRCNSEEGDTPHGRGRFAA